MAWRLLINLKRIYVHDTPPKYTIYSRKWTFWRSRMATWPSLCVCPVAISVVWDLEGEISNIYSVYLACYIFQNYLKSNGKNMETVSSLGTGKQFYIFVKVGYYPPLSLAALAFNFIHCLLLSVVNYYIVYWVYQCSIIWPIGS